MSRRLNYSTQMMFFEVLQNARGRSIFNERKLSPNTSLVLYTKLVVLFKGRRLMFLVFAFDRIQNPESGWFGLSLGAHSLSGQAYASFQEAICVIVHHDFNRVDA